MKFLFVTLQHRESDFYGRVGRNLERGGHEVVQLTYSRRAAQALRRHGTLAHCVPDLVRELPRRRRWYEDEPRIVDRYPIDSLRDVYGTDPPFRRGDGADRCAER